MKLHISLVWLILVPMFSACSSNDSSTGADDQICAPGERVACTGDDGCPGYQACTPDGIRLSTCICDQPGEQGGEGGQEASGGSAGMGGGETDGGGGMGGGGVGGGGVSEGGGGRWRRPHTDGGGGDGGEDEG